MTDESKSRMARLDATATSWKPEVQTDDSGKWYGNGLRFATRAEAEDNAHNLMMRWMLVREYRAAPSAEPVNYRWVNGKLESVEAAPIAPSAD